MTQMFEAIEQVSVSTKHLFTSDPQLATIATPKEPQIRHELAQKIHTALQSAQDLPAQDCLKEIRTRLLAIRADCTTIGKTFIVVEERITCNQYDLGGCQHDRATLFRGPREDASVAICVTDQGSLLHRNSSQWQVYRNVGDILCNVPNISSIDE